MTAQRQLIVMRHAKAGELPGGPDIERALRPRGRRNASAAGQWMASRGLAPDLVLCSKARRARQTWQYVGAELAAKPPVINDPRLYVAGATEVLDIVAETEARVRSLMYVGHNPAAVDLTELLIGEPADFPTCAIAVVALRPPWPDLASGMADGIGELIAAWTPQSDGS